MKRAVLDTNVLVSGLISPHGAPAQLIGAWRQKQFELILSPAILGELGEVLQRERIRRYYEHVDEALAGKYLAGLRRLATIVPGAIKVEGASTDPGDDKFLAAALEGHTDCIVSGDKHLLDIKEYQGIAIVRPAQFLAQL